MELVTTHSEEGLSDLLEVIMKTPDTWLSAHVNMSRISEQLLEKENLSRQVLDNIRQSSMRIAKLLMNSEIGKSEGKIFVFEDSDVLALFKKDENFSAQALETLKHDFIIAGLIQFLTVSSMQERLDSLVEMAKEKHENAKIFLQRKQAVEVAETIFQQKKQDPELTRAILKKRHNRMKKVILIIEDDIVARGIVAMTLRDGYQVVQAKDAKDGIIAYIDKAPNMVFLDIHLPDHKGQEVLECLKLLEPKAYVVMLSGDSVTNNVLSTKELGAAGFVRKPFLKENILKHAKNCA